MVPEDVFLETDRLVIRNWRADDWLLIRPMSLDPEVMQYIGHYQPWSEDETRQFASNRMSDFKRYGWTMWPLVFKETDAFVGYCGFLRRMYGEYEGEIEIGYALAKDAWGKGLRRRRARGFSGMDLSLWVSSGLLPAHGRRMQGRSA